MRNACNRGSGDIGAPGAPAKMRTLQKLGCFLAAAVFTWSAAGEAQAFAPQNWRVDCAVLPIAVVGASDAKEAVQHMAAQGVFKGASAVETPMTKGEFVLALQHMFALTESPDAPTYTDVPANSALGSALRAVDPYLGGHILCPGCDFGSNFLADQPISNVYASFLTTLVLIGQNKLQPLSPAEADAVLAKVPDAGSLPPPSRVYFAAAIQGGVLPLGLEKRIGSTQNQTHGDAALLLDRVQLKFAIPEARP
jgi:hypothetical protein